MGHLSGMLWCLWLMPRTLHQGAETGSSSVLMKAMDMRFHWLRDRIRQKQFSLKWAPGATNPADCHTKHHSAKHHKKVRPICMAEPNSSTEMQGFVDLLALHALAAHRAHAPVLKPFSWPCGLQPAKPIPTGNPALHTAWFPTSHHHTRQQPSTKCSQLLETFIATPIVSRLVQFNGIGNAKSIAQENANHVNVVMDPNVQPPCFMPLPRHTHPVLNNQSNDSSLPSVPNSDMLSLVVTPKMPLSDSGPRTVRESSKIECAQRAAVCVHE